MTDDLGSAMNMNMYASPSEPSRPLSGHSSRAERKAGMSCAECRRSKLKCDRVFPCSACVRRNCASICPDGILAATKGNKVLQMQNEQLMSSMKRMTMRIKELEGALAETQSQVSPQPHPLLRDGKKLTDADVEYLLDGGSPRGTRDDASDLIGSLSIGEKGQSKYHGQSSASEFLQTLLPNSEEEQAPPMQSSDLEEMGFSDGVIDLINAFPFRSIRADPSAAEEIIGFLPDSARILSLSLCYFVNVTCPHRIVSQETYVPWAMEINRKVLTGSTIGNEIHSHQMALIYAVLAIGAFHTSEENRDATAEKYYHLACAALSLDPITKEASSTTLQTLFVMMHYHNCRDHPGCERRWLLGGLLYRMTYSLGLHRDPSLWKLSQEEIQCRRRLFWELYSWDAWSSIVNGRPPSLNITYTDCRFPEDDSPVLNAKGEKEMGFDAFKYRLAAFVLAPVLSHVFSVREPNYAQLMDIDIKLRKLSPPSWLLSPTGGKGEPVDGRSWNANSALAMQQYCLVCVRESTLLYIHRRYLTKAIKLNKEDPLKTKYSASVLAASRSACLLLSSLRSLYGAHKEMASKQSFFWSGAFSAVIVLCCLVYNSPRCKLAGDALKSIDDGVELYSMRVFDNTELSMKLLSSVRETVHGMFDTRHKIKEGKPAISTHDDSKCPMMHVLEGAASLITPDELKSVLNDQDAPPSASSSSESSSSPQPQSRFPSEEMDPTSSSAVIMRRASESSLYTPDKPMIDASASPEYAGGVNDGAGRTHFATAAAKRSMQPHSFSQTTSPLSGYSPTAMNVPMGDVSSIHPGAQNLAPSGGNNHKYPTDMDMYASMQDQVFAHGFDEMGHSRMEDMTNGTSVLSYGAGPGVQIARGYELTTATAAGAAGSALPGVNDQENWERFFGQMGYQNEMHIGQQMF